MSRLQAKSAREMMKARQDSFEKTAQTIRNMIDSSIRDSAKIGKCSVTVNIPASVFGHEPYELVGMGKEIARQLFSDGYQVAGTYSRMTISWSDPTPKKKEEDVVIKVPKPKFN
jgi:hypothetical protein